jgi:hypothetical protein
MSTLQANTTLEGTFTILDINGNVLSTQKNKITDWGMIRISGHGGQTPFYVRSLADNLRKIWIGEGTAPVKGSDYELNTYIDGSYFTETNDPAITGTFYELIDAGLPTEKLKIKFVKGSRFDFSNTILTQINEVGISSNYQPPYGEYLSGVHQWEATTSFPAIPNKRGGSGPYGTGWPYPHENKLETSLFSRSLMAQPVDIIRGDILIIKYVLEVVTDAHRIGDESTFPFNISTITDGVPMPARKTNVRRKFFYELLPNNTVSGLLQDSSYPYQGGRATADQGVPSNSMFWYNATLQFLPFLEVPAFGKNYLALYPDSFSGIYLNLGNNSSTAHPATTATDADYMGERVGVNYNWPPYSTSTKTVAANYLLKKERTTFKSVSSVNTITCQHRFLFNPGEWSAPSPIKNFCFLRQNWTSSYAGNAWDVQPSIDDRTKVGMFTAMLMEYNPYEFNNSLYLGLDYTMTFTRL